MSDIVIVALVTLAGTIFSATITAAISNKLTNYRISELEKKIDKTNNIAERVAVVERDLNTAFIRIDECKSDVKEIRGKL